jgi:hypothetical protein
MPVKSVQAFLSITGLFLLVFLAPQSSSAQRFAFKPQVHQLELQLGSVNSIPAVSSEYGSDLPFSTDFVNGGRYTYHYSLTHGFRVGAFRRTSAFSSTEIDQFSQYQADKQDIDITLGYMYKHHINATQLFAGVDLRYSMGNLDETGTEFNGPAPANYQFAYDYQTYGLGGFFGLRYFVSQNLSLALEGNITYATLAADGISSSDPTRFSLLPENVIDFSAGATVSFHFVRMKKRCTCP